MDTKNGKITTELVGALNERDREVQHANLGYIMKPPEERILYALDVFRGFDPMAEPGATRTTHIEVADRPGTSIDARIEFPTIKSKEEKDAGAYKWTNEIVVKARANDGNLRHEQPDFAQLGVFEFDGPSVARLFTKDGKPIRFDEPGSEEIMEIIDSAVLDDFYKKEEVRRIAGKGALAAYWEKISSEVPPETGVFSRIKDFLIGKRPK